MCERRSGTPGRSWRAGGRWAGLLGLLLSPWTPLPAPAAPATPGQPAWEERLYNPHPAPGDLILPLPCGGAMAFRAVDVPGEGPLADRKVLLGSPDPRFALMEGPRFDYLNGGFVDPKSPARRHYYLAKYETSRLQWEAVTGPECPTPTLAGRLPVVEVSWFDAVAFAGRWGEWLARHAPGSLPATQGQSPFPRLPTESEWEFAARGGVAVSPTEFEAPTFPMPDGLPRYVWFQGTRSANGRLQLTGLLQPNPLGLHDMLGNADELVGDPFRVNKLGRLAGQAGGFVLKGGNYLTSESEVRSAYRQEYAPLDGDGVRTVRTVGFRLALSAPVIPSPQRLEALRQAWAALPQGAALQPGGGQPLADPLAELEAITRETPDPDLRRRLDGLKRVLAERVDQEETLRARAAKSLIRLGSFLGAKFKGDVALVERAKGIREALKAGGTANLTEVEASIQRNEQLLRENLLFYADTVGQTAQDFAPGAIAQQAENLKVEFENRGRPQLKPFADLFAAHVAAYRRSGRAQPQQWLEDYVKQP